jgi:hypothetical protein
VLLLFENLVLKEANDFVLKLQCNHDGGRSIGFNYGEFQYGEQNHQHY